MEKNEIEQYHELDNKIRRVITQQVDKIQRLRVGKSFSGTIEFYYNFRWLVRRILTRWTLIRCEQGDRPTSSKNSPSPRETSPIYSI